MNETTYRWTVVVCNVLGGLAAGFSGMLGLTSGHWGPILLIGGVILLATPPLASLAVTIRRAGLDVRDSALATLTELCYVLIGLPDECDLRVTLLRVDTTTEPARLRGMARGGGDRKAPTSKMTIHQGVAGLCYRTAKVAQKPDVTDFVSEMKELGFESEDIKQFQPDRRSYLCLPVLVNGSVVAVVSCDAKNPNVFEQQQEKVVEKLTPFFARLLTIEEKVKE